MTAAKTNSTGRRRLKEIEADTFVDALDCSTKGWHTRRKEDEDLSDGDIFGQEQHSRLRRIAERAFSETIRVSGDTLAKRVTFTKECMEKRSTKVLLGATFRVDGYTVRVDILVRVRGGWRLILVSTGLKPKSGKRLDQAKIDRVAFAWMVATAAGVKIVEAKLRLLSRDYRKSMDEERLFVEMDVSKRVKDGVSQWRPLMQSIRRRTSSSRRPSPSVVPACNSCDYFSTECLGKGIEFPVTELPRLGDRILELPDLDIEALPEEVVNRGLTERQKRVAMAVQSGEPLIGPDVGAALSNITLPTYYLDFETTATEYPLYEGIAPHENVLIQYSLDRSLKAGKLDRHTEFLADPRRNCERELAERLLEELGTKGSIVVYSSFERARIEALGRRFPDLAKPLEKLVARLFDLLKEIMAPLHFYDRRFRGSSSIKAVLPVLSPGLNYDGLSVSDGRAASIAFARLALGEFTEREAHRVRKELLEYCGLDSRAMFEVHQALLASI